jgi:hypothetical protein
LARPIAFRKYVQSARLCGFQGANAVMENRYKYRAFISYSHADEKWARWLHRGLEGYGVPRRLVGTRTAYGTIPARFSPVFLDREELATAASLGDTLTSALEQSAFQIVICSTAAARSRWVNQEILTYKRLGRERRIFCLVVDGEPGASSIPGREHQECFPRALVHRMGADGNLTEERSEPIAADIRPGRDSRSDAKLKLVAGMLGVGLDDLKQRDTQRRNRRLAMLAAASVAGMAMTSMLATAAWVARNDAQRQRVRAEAEAETARQTTRFLMELLEASGRGRVSGSPVDVSDTLAAGRPERSCQVPAGDNHQGVSHEPIAAGEHLPVPGSLGAALIQGIVPMGRGHVEDL